MRNLIWTLMLVSFGTSGSTYAAQLSEAYVGQPYGVGKVTVSVMRGKAALPLSDERFTLEEINGRAFYPALQEEPVRTVVRQLLKMEAPRQVTLYYLFRGDEPFDLSVFAPNEQGVRVSPQNDPSRHASLLDEWWTQMTQRLARMQKNPEYPPVAENFLTSVMARRLQKDIPEPKQGLLPWMKSKDSAFDELFVSEAYQLQVDRELLENPWESDPDFLPLPEEFGRKPAPPVEKDRDSTCEPMATYVPQECFYIRFGNFTNYLWFRDLNKKWQGDIGNMILRRGILRGSSERAQQQLSLRENALAKILGPQVIADAAIIGLDPYVGQGAAIGILFQAKNNLLLSQDLIRQRRAALTNFPDAQEESVKILDQDVSLISTPNGEVRSYYYQQEDFHLVTTSSTLLRRFIEAGTGSGALANNPDFLQAREKFPLQNEYTVFAFISPDFFENLCSPQYRVETERRVRSYRERHLLELARYAAKVENHAAFSLEQLVEAGILPPGFGGRVDESKMLETEEGFLDDVRGAPGYYVPVPDVPVEFVSAAEVKRYEAFSKRIEGELGEFPPVAVGVQRIAQEGTSNETMVIDLAVSEVGKTKLASFAESLGKPNSQRLAPIEGDLLSFEAELDMALPLIGGESQAHHLFGALRDFRSPLLVQGGGVVPGDKPAELVRGYLGAWPKPGLLQLFVDDNSPPEEKPGQVGDELWQAKQNEFLVISFKPSVIEDVLPNLSWEPAERDAQIRLRLNDLSNTDMSHNVNALGYMRSRETSVAASRFMNSLANQLQIPRPECREVAERLADGQFRCALGGEYQMYATERGLEVWLSSALPEENRFLLTEVPDDFQLPLLDWFRGLRGDLELSEDQLRVHLEVDMTEAALP